MSRGEWFESRRSGSPPGLRFSCTMCGRCCSGPAGYVLFTLEESRAIARRLGLSEAEFMDRYTSETSKGRSLSEVRTNHGHDCVFLDRESVPGRGVCSIYEDRPLQCRTWPFWKSNLESPAAWADAGRTCPGIDKGQLFSARHVSLTRDRSPL